MFLREMINSLLKFKDTLELYIIKSPVKEDI